MDLLFLGLPGGIELLVLLFVAIVLFTLLAYVGRRVVLSVLRRVLARMFSDRRELVIQLFVTVVGVFLGSERRWPS